MKVQVGVAMLEQPCIRCERPTGVRKVYRQYGIEIAVPSCDSCLPFVNVRTEADRMTKLVRATTLLDKTKGESTNG